MKELLIALTIALCVAFATCTALYVLYGTVTGVDAVAALVFSGLMVAPRCMSLEREPPTSDSPPASDVGGDHRGLR